MPDARVVANRFLELAGADGGRALTPMQVLKLVYIAHGWHLGLYGRPLVEQSVEAWQYGPVIPELYAAMRHFRSSVVTGTLPEPRNDRALTPDEADLVAQVYRIYGHMSGIELSRITHASGTPWQQVYRPGCFGEEIPVDLIEEHYQRLNSERRTNATQPS